MACTLELDSIKTFPGTTLFTTDSSTCLKKSAVYASAKHSDSDNAYHVVLYLHGFYVQNPKFFFHTDPTKVREQVRDSGKDVLVVAPFLGHTWYNKEKKAYEGNYSTSDLGGSDWGQKYLDEVLGALAAFRKIKPAELTVRSLTIACHSGGGSGMRALVSQLGKYRGQLKELWGLDCLYGIKAQPDDATFWHDFMLKPDSVPAYFWYGGSTMPQSVKLYLMGRGLADRQGNIYAEQAHPPMSNLHVEIGQAVTGDIEKMMIPAPFKPTTTRRGVPLYPGEFARSALNNLSNKVRFHDDIHYMIARERFLERLKGASYL